MRSMFFFYIAKALAFKPEKPNLFIGHYWFVVPLETEATGCFSVVLWYPTGAFGFNLLASKVNGVV